MADSSAPEKAKQGESPALKSGDGWLGLLRRAGQAVMPAVLTAGGVFGFIAFAGSVIVWTRFYAAQVPPDQAVAAYPRGELVAIASALLLVFGCGGLMAVLGFYLINRKGEATMGTSRGILALLAIEGVATILMIEGSSSSWEHRIVACELFLLPTFVAFWATFLYERPESENGDNPGESSSWFGDDVVQAIIRREFATVVIVTAAIAAAIVAILTFLVDLPFLTALIPGLALVAIVPTLTLVPKWISEDNKRPRRELKPGKVPFTRRGVAVILVAMLVGAITTSWALERGWLVIPLLSAAVIAASLWRIAVLSGGKFGWYGLAVFLSVPLFGTILWTTRNLADPQVQPVALIRESDGPDEALQGLYVTETDSRIYFATVASEGCTDDLVPHSGRLLWVPKSEVVAMSIGPLQKVGSAARTALEMSYALTPAVETPAGDRVSLTVAEKRTEVAAESKRLEEIGAAVHPHFGDGLSLDPENASPGDVVTLSMSAPAPAVQGFGPSREGRTLRVGGVTVDVIKEEARGVGDAEYVETVTGETLTLEKRALYEARGDGHVEVDVDSVSRDAVLFVKLNDSSVAKLEREDRDIGNFLRLGGEEPVRLADPVAGKPLVATMKDGSEAAVEAHLLRQAWHEDHIKFRVPASAITGPVTVECEQLAGEPLLRVARTPGAQVTSTSAK